MNYLTKTIFNFSLASLLASASARSLNSMATDLLRSISETLARLYLFSLNTLANKDKEEKVF
jgi:hypothetical protein